MLDPSSPQSWLRVTPKGLYCAPGDFFIDPTGPVERAIVTHGHGDHARSGHKHVLATKETLAIMRHRFPDDAGTRQALPYGEALALGDVRVTRAPAVYTRGGGRVVPALRGRRIVVWGDYKRRPDPTCPPFEPVPCD